MTNEQLAVKIKDLESVIDSLIQIIRTHCEISVDGSDALIELSVKLDEN